MTTNNRKIDNNLIEIITKKIELNHKMPSPRHLLVDYEYTKIIKQILENMKSVSVVESAFKITDDNYVGFHISDVLTELLERADGNLEKAEKGIIVLKNFEFAFPTNDDNFIVGTNIQQAIKPYLEGKKISVNYENKNYLFDTSDLTFICIGNFKEKTMLFISKEMKDNYDCNFSYAFNLIKEMPLAGKEMLTTIRLKNSK